MAIQEGMVEFHELCDLLSEISESCYFAGWLHDVEHEVWDMLGSKEPVQYGMSHVSPTDLARAEALSKAIGGWVQYEQGPRFVPAGEWARRHAAWVNKRTPKRDEVQFPWARRVVNG